MVEPILHILHLEDDPLDAAMVADLLRDGGLAVHADRVSMPGELLNSLERKSYQLVLSDYSISGTDPLEVLRQVRRLRPDLPFVFVCSTLGEDVAVEALKSGATDYVLKQRLDRLVPAVRRALQEVEEQARRKQAEDALRRSEQRLRATFNNAALGILEADQNGRIADANERICQILDYRREELLGRTIRDLTVPEDREQSDRLNALLLTGQRDRIEYEKRYLKRDASPLWARVAVAAMRDPDGRPIGFIGTIEDISQRKRIEEALRQSEERHRVAAEELQAIMDATPAGICVAHDPQCRLITGNQVAHELFGVPAEQNISSTPPEGDLSAYVRIYRDGQEMQGSDMPMQQAAATGATIRNVELEALRRDGSRRAFLLTAAPLRSPDGTIRGAVGAFTDITQRKQASEALRESEAKMRAFVESNVIGILYGDLDGGVYDCNEELARIIGRSRQDVLDGRVRWTQITPQEDLPLDDRAAQEAKATGRCTPYEKHYIRPDGTRVPIVVGYVLLEPERHKSVAFILDISQRKRAEVELASAKAAAEDASKAKDHFLAVLSHELRTPLTPVVAAVSMLQEQVSADETLRDTLEMIRRNVEMEARLIDDLLDVTRIVRGKIELDRKPTLLCEVLRRAVEVCRPDIETRQIHFGVDIGKDAPYQIDADPARLQQVFWNLLKNAIKFTPHGGCIGIRCRREDGQVIAEVSDSGEGIEPHLLPHIFNPFEQGGARVTRQFGGLGLGLTITKGVVEMHGGSVEACSPGKGKGATFRVRLPLCGEPVTLSVCPPDSLGPVAHMPSTLAPAQAQKLRILLVEDHGDTARIMRRLLAARGYQVETAGDIATAVELVEHESFDLLLSDLGLPDGSGIDLMRTLREHGRTIPGIALSGYGQEEDIRRSKDAGFSAHLTKPTNPDQLVATIATATRPGAAR